ncbi:MAG: Dabb family protein [Verrucomicrobiota bacterium]
MEHHVYFWLNEEGQSHSTLFEAALEKLLAIESVSSGTWGRPAATPERPVIDRSWDYGLSLRFESVAAHDAYQVDPLHEEFVESQNARWSKVLVMDLA